MTYSIRKAGAALIGLLLLTVPVLAHAQSADPFEHGWVMNAESSELRFLSVKKGTVAESSRFATYSGVISPEGEAQIVVMMDSVDTNVDLRNVRMRFLFFETFKFPEAKVTAKLSADQLKDLHITRHKFIDLPIKLNLHGITLERTEEVAVTLIDNDRVAVANTAPIALALTDFNLEEGRVKLEEAANVDILPFGFVSFDFVFDRSQPGTPPALAMATTTTPGAAALETKGDLDRDACIGRLEILSRTGNIYFRPGSARLDKASLPLLENLFDIVNRCPDLKIEIGGHTDSDGSAQSNQRLSERRAASVLEYLTSNGVPAGRLVAVGFGEAKPVVANTSVANKARNRRIEFVPIGS